MSHPVKTHKQAAVPQCSHNKEEREETRDKEFSCLSKHEVQIKTQRSEHFLFREIKEFLPNRPQTARLGPHLSSTLTLSTSSPQGCELSPLLYSLYTYNCTPTHPTNLIIKSLITQQCLGYKRAYRDKLQTLTMWCSENNLTLNITKTNELIIDLRKHRREPPLFTNRAFINYVVCGFLIFFWTDYRKKKHIQQSCSSQKFHGPGASGAHSKLQTWPPSSAGWRGRFYRCWWDQHGKSPSSGWHELRGTWQTHTLLNINSIWNTRSTCSWHSGVGSYNIEHTS